MQITMIGHSTLLIETQGKRILTDPYFSTHGAPAYKRLAPPAMTRQELANADIVLVSHAHFDHIDRSFLRSLPATTPVLAPRLSLARFLIGPGLVKVENWQRQGFGEIAITAVPAVHPAVTNGYVIESEGLTVYFAADTYFRPFMKTLHERFHIDVALMPVTTFRIPMTMGEREAVQAMQVLQPRVVIPIHLGIQPRSPLMRTQQSPEGFTRRLREAGITTSVVVLKEGAVWNSNVLALE
jgi:L-ascorbate metabolism protein UlaG (beta-lactamase superfamily)